MDINNTRSYFKWALTCAIGLIVVPVGFYFYQFGKYGLSHNSEDWGILGDYLNVWVSMASLILLATLTYVIYKDDEARDNDRYKEEKARNRPILIFKVDNREKVWYVKNVGNGVALNIYISYQTDGFSWMKPVKVYSLMVERN